MEHNSANKETDLKAALINGISDAIGIVKEIEKEMMDCANLLRVQQSDRIFGLFSEGINNLNHLFEFIKELKAGMAHLKGINVPAEALLCWDGAHSIFKDMLSAFENKDWVTLSDLIQYELSPLLLESEKGLSDLKEGFR